MNPYFAETQSQSGLSHIDGAMLPYMSGVTDGVYPACRIDELSGISPIYQGDMVVFSGDESQVLIGEPVDAVSGAVFHTTSQARRGNGKVLAGGIVTGLLGLNVLLGGCASGPAVVDAGYCEDKMLVMGNDDNTETEQIEAYNAVVNQCTEQKDIGYFQPRLDALESIAQNPDLSPRSREVLMETLSWFKSLYRQGIIDMRVYKYPRMEVNYGHIQSTINHSEIGERDIRFRIMLIPDTERKEAQILNQAAHEWLHMKNMYEIFRSGLLFEGRDDELEAQYYGHLVEALAIKQGIGNRDDESCEIFGADDPSITLVLNQRGIGPDTALYDFISDSLYRHMYLYYKTHTEARMETDPNILLYLQRRKRVADYASDIKEIEVKWKGFAKAGSNNRAILEELITMGLASSETFQYAFEEEEQSFVEPVETGSAVTGIIPQKHPMEAIPAGVYVIRGTNGFPLSGRLRG